MDQAALEEFFRQISLRGLRLGARHQSQQSLVDSLVEEGCLATPEVIEAFTAVDRARFLTERCQGEAYVDAPVRDGKLHQSAPSVYAKALEALELRPGLSFLNIGSGTGYFSALVAQLIGPRAWSLGVECQEEIVHFARERCAEVGLSDIHFQHGNCFCIDVDKSMRFDRIYVGAGAPRDARFLYKLLKYDGIIVGPFEDEDGGSQSLSKARCRGGTRYAVTQLLPVQFAGLVRPGKVGPDNGQAREELPVVLLGPRWDTSCHAIFPLSFRRIVVVLRWLNGIAGSMPSKLPWEVWDKYILCFLPFDAFEPGPAGPPRCAACGGPAAALQCGRCRATHYCGRECQRRDWPSHKGTCFASSS